MKTSLIITVFNEEKTIELLLNSIIQQSKLPDEVVITDGGSTDKTLSILGSYKTQFKEKNIAFKIIVKRGNRAVGRNEAIRNVAHKIILITDAGCILDKNWVMEITQPLKSDVIDVVAGYYRGTAENIFQKCIVPYVLVMPDRIDCENFLPATRSMALKKSVWSELDGFPEEYSHNEDYVFAKEIERHKFNRKFIKNAIVEWLPPKHIYSVFRMFYRFALGDAEARIYRKKALFILFRYLIGLVLLLIGILLHVYQMFFLLTFFVCMYAIWAIQKNYRYIRNIQAFFILPVLQIISDIAVISGTIKGSITNVKSSP